MMHIEVYMQSRSGILEYHFQAPYSVDAVWDIPRQWVSKGYHVTIRVHSDPVIGLVCPGCNKVH